MFSSLVYLDMATLQYSTIDSNPDFYANTRGGLSHVI